MNENRGVFALDGITGMLIATVLLLSILAGLTVWGIAVQQGSSDHYYYLDNPKEIKMKSVDNVNHFKFK
jgi:hypothetical protein